MQHTRDFKDHAILHFDFTFSSFQVDVVVCTAGGIEEDFMKCLAPTYLGDFKMKGSELRRQGVNRLGNLLIPNNNYCLFEDWFSPILNAMTDEQVMLSSPCQAHSTIASHLAMKF